MRLAVSRRLRVNATLAVGVWRLIGHKVCLFLACIRCGSRCEGGLCLVGRNTYSVIMCV